MCQSEDLWPDLDFPHVRSPHTILREQAAFLTTKSKGLIVGRVTRFTHKEDFGAAVSVITLDLQVPALGNYSYQLLSLEHDPVLLYPVKSADGTELENEEALKTYLQSAFNSHDTRNVLRSLISQSSEAKPDSARTTQDTVPF